MEGGVNDLTWNIIYSMDYLDIIVPCFNESERLPETFKVIESWNPESFVPRFVFVNDGSSDHTDDTVSDWAEQTDVISTLVSYPVNKGKGGAIREAVLRNTFDEEAALFCHWDADASIDIENIENAYEMIVQGNFDIAIANRRLSGSHERNASSYRSILSHVFRLYSKIVLPSHGFADTQCGLKMYRYDKCVRLFSELKEERFLFDLEVLMKASAEGLRVCEFPVQWEHVDGSSVTFWQSARNALISPWHIRASLKTLSQER